MKLRGLPGQQLTRPFDNSGRLDTDNPAKDKQIQKTVVTQFHAATEQIHLEKSWS